MSEIETKNDSEATDRELDAMRKIEAALLPLTEDERARVIGCVAILYGVEIRSRAPALPPAQERRPPPVFIHPVRRWRTTKRRARARHCRECGELGHDKRKCPLNFEITVEVES